MKIAEKTNGVTSDGSIKPQESKTQEKKINGLLVSKSFAGEVKSETEKSETKKVEEVKKEMNQNPESQSPDETKAKQGFNLESTLKLVEDLHRKKVQRDKLLQTITNLEGFEIQQEEDSEATGGSSRFQRCELVITDDKGNDFVTKNPVIIQAVARHVNRLCTERLGEIEAGILLPE